MAGASTPGVVTGRPPAELDLSGLTRGDADPLISVVVPTYGDAEFVGGALESIAAQTYGSVEAVVVDSSAVTWLESLATSTDGLSYVFQEPRGLAAARNRGIDEARGEVVGFLDADDRWQPAKLETQVRAIRDGADVVYSDAVIVSPDGPSFVQSSLPVRNPKTHHLDFLYEGGVPILTVVARRECLLAERFDETLPAVEDRNLLARLFARYEPARIPEPLATYARREGSMSSDPELMYRSELASLDRLVDDIPGLNAHRRSLEALATYKYGKRLLRTGSASEARRMLLAARRAGFDDPRLYVLLAVSLLPAGQREALRTLERLQQGLTRLQSGLTRLQDGLMHPEDGLARPEGRLAHLREELDRIRDGLRSRRR